MVLVVAVLATAFEASVENARVANAYGIVDEVEEQLAAIEAEMANLTERRENLEPGPERQVIENRLADLQAQFEMAEKDRMALVLAITGFTILSPEQRAREIVRQVDLQRHRGAHCGSATSTGPAQDIRFALRYYVGGNLFSFSEEDHDFLQRSSRCRAARSRSANAPRRRRSRQPPAMEGELMMSEFTDGKRCSSDCCRGLQPWQHPRWS